MDPVSEVLIERERSRPRLVQWVLLALMLHAGAVAAAYVAGRRTARRPMQLPSVSVKLVRPAPVRRRPPQRAPAREASPVPQPTAVPTALPEPPKVEPQPDRPPPSTDAMPAAEAESTPRPTPVPAPAGTGSGLSLGSDRTGEDTGIPADFHFTYYVERMLALIESRWYKPAAAPGTRARVRFSVLRTGKIEGITLEESSGIPSFDRAALRALYAANPLPPLPPAYAKPSVTVHLSFAE